MADPFAVNPFPNPLAIFNSALALRSLSTSTALHPPPHSPTSAFMALAFPPSPTVAQADQVAALVIGIPAAAAMMTMAEKSAPSCHGKQKKCVFYFLC